MAARQDQTIVIINILCIVLVVALIGTTYWGFKLNSESQQQLASTSKSLQDAQSQTRTIQGENEDLRVKFGVGANDSSEAVQTAFAEDMKKYAPGDNPNASYRSALADLHKRLEETEASEAKAKDQINQLMATLQAKEEQTNAQIQAIDAERKKAVEAEAAARAQYTAYRAQLDEEKVSLMRSLETQKNAFEQQIGNLNTQIATLTEQAAKMQATITRLIEGAKPPTFSQEIADGSITYVTQDGVVWINLGSADALRPLVTFSVYDMDVKDTSKTEPKATIEVTSIMGPRQAEARVTSDDPRNPILRGDQIYSPAWQRGKPLHFAFTGNIDVNDDGQSDLQLVRNLVTLNDGVVDSYLGDDGNVEGAMTVGTRFLVLGRVPEGPLRTKHLEGWQAMHKEAASLGVEAITLDQFLDKMGYRPESRAVQLGSAGTARDFPARSASDAASQGVGGVPPRFRARTPMTSTPTSQAPSPMTPGPAAPAGAAPTPPQPASTPR
jgi:hypothetical protein